MKAMEYARKVKKLGELLRRNLNAARRVNDAALLRKVTRFLVTRGGKYIHAMEVTLNNLREQ
jgi:DUF1009 family protein